MRAFTTLCSGKTGSPGPQGAGGVVTVGALGVAVLVLAASAASGQRMEATRLFEVSKPAVVMVKVWWKANISVPTPLVNSAKTKPVEQEVLARYRAGQLTKEEALITFYKEIVKNWSSYLEPHDPTRTLTATVGATGSGWFVNPDGYIVTNAHVAAPDPDELKAHMAGLGLQEFLKNDTQVYLNTWANTIGGSPPDDILALTKNAVVGFYQATMTMSKVTQATFASTGISSPGGETTAKDMQASVEIHGEPIPGKDVAIIKVEAKNMPTLPVGDSAALKTGDLIYTLGYPGAATFHPLLSTSSQIEPTLTRGVISAKKTMQGGWDILQTDASTTHGNSGGPALDANGRVIGIVTFGSIDPNSSQEIQGLNFIVPISVIQEFLAKQNIKPEQGLVSKLYSQALDDMDISHYRAAMGKLQEINGISPGHAYVADQISTAQKAIAEGKDRTYRSLKIVGGLVVLLAVVLIVALGARGRGKAWPQASSWPQAPVPAPPRPPVPPPPQQPAAPVAAAPPAAPAPAVSTTGEESRPQPTQPPSAARPPAAPLQQPPADGAPQ